MNDEVITHSVDYMIYVSHSEGSWTWVGITNAENAVLSAAQAHGVLGRAVKVERVEKTEVRSTAVYVARRDS